MSVRKLRLKGRHTWKCKPGYLVCVIDRGRVRFDFPSRWIVEPGPGAVLLHDQPPSVESCDLGVSIFRVPNAQVRELPLDEPLRGTPGDDRVPYQQTGIRHSARGDLEIAWLEQRYLDTGSNRDARFRVALARGQVICLISMNYRSSRAALLEPVWDECSDNS